jgi:hypothetical protein
MPVEKGAAPPPPWKFGRHHIVVARRVGEDEQISIEFYTDKQPEAQDWVDKYLAALRDHMVKYNQQVVLAMKKQLRVIEDRIEERGAVLRELEEKIETHEREQQGVPASQGASAAPTPAPKEPVLFEVD